MTSSIPTQILLDTSILSKIISDVLDEVGAPSARKSVCLNRAAARIAGTKHNWGYLTAKQGQFTALGLNSSAPEPSINDEQIAVVEADPDHVKKAIAALEAGIKDHFEDRANRSEIRQMVYDAAKKNVYAMMPLSAEIPDWDVPLQDLQNAYIAARGAFRLSDTSEMIAQDMRQNHANLIETAAIAYYQECMARSKVQPAVMNDPVVAAFITAMAVMSAEDKLSVKAALQVLVPGY